MSDISSLGSFNRKSQSSHLANRGAGVSLREGNRILRASDKVAAAVEAHHAKHAKKWISKAYGDLLQKHGQERAPMPSWAATSAQSRLMAQAEARIAAKLESRMQRVSSARDKMLQSGGMRTTRKLSWDRGLG